MSLPSRHRVVRGFRVSFAVALAGSTVVAGCSQAAPPSRNSAQAGSTGAGASTGAAAGLITGAAGSNSACATASAAAMLVKQPVDIILVLDNSGSMADELAAVETNINVNFATILNQAGIDYRVILISRHRKDVRAASGESSTSVCIEAPLSGLAACPSPANPVSVPAPKFSDKFFQYNVKIESHDSLETGILTGYGAPDTRTNLTTMGWKIWLRPKTKKVFLELTDDDEGGPDDTLVLTVDSFISQLTTMAPEFGTPQDPAFVFHSIVGLAEKAVATDAYQPGEPIQSATCIGNGDKVANAGNTYQELSRRTGGLRFPICQFAGYDTVFHTVANDVITKSQIACDFSLPPPPSGTSLDLDKVAVNYTRGDGTAVMFGQAKMQADCQSNAFYIQDSRIFLCPDTCNTVQADEMASVDVLFTCQSTIIVK